MFICGSKLLPGLVFFAVCALHKTLDPSLLCLWFVSECIPGRNTSPVIQSVCCQYLAAEFCGGFDWAAFIPGVKCCVAFSWLDMRHHHRIAQPPPVHLCFARENWWNAHLKITGILAFLLKLPEEKFDCTPEMIFQSYGHHNTYYSITLIESKSWYAGSLSPPSSWVAHSGGGGGIIHRMKYK